MLTQTNHRKAGNWDEVLAQAAGIAVVARADGERKDL